MLLAGLQAVLGQDIRITGAVTSDTGEPLTGVSVMVSGTHRGVVTDGSGQYAISAPADATLEFSLLGMKSRQVAVEGRNRIDAVLEADAQTIDNVIVTAFGTSTKEAFTGSASVLDGTDIERRQVSNISKALAGQVAGVQVVSNSGQPGTAGQIRIRGVGSINASSAPLYVVDGVPYDGDLSAINSADIETMTVLKDAASNALYGARGANGVILITTRKGKKGEAVVNLDAKWGVNSRGVPEYDIMKNPGTYYETFGRSLINSDMANYGSSFAEAEAWANSYLVLPTDYDSQSSSALNYRVYTVPDGEGLLVNGKLNPKAKLGYLDEITGNYYLPDDWSDAAYHNGLRQEYNLSVSGASDRLNYYFSAGYLNDEGYVVNSGLERVSARLKADYQAKSWLKIGGNVSFANNKTQDPDFEQTGSMNMFYATRNMAPIYPLYVRDEKGNIRIDKRGRQIYDYGDGTTSGIERPFLSQANPISAQELDTQTYLSDIFGGRAYAEISFLKDFKFTFNAGFDVDNTRFQYRRNSYYGQMANSGGEVSVEHLRDAALNLQELLTWKKSFGKHNVDVLLGHEYYSLKKTDLWGNKTGLYNPEIPELGNAINSPSTSSKIDEYFTEGYLGRVQYDYDNKYFFSASYRRDASSRFHPDHRWGNFWSVGASWLVSREDFMQNVSSWLNFLKFKISYGSQGNDGLLDPVTGLPDYYPYQNIYTLSNNANDYALTLSSVGNPNIKWETNYNFNTGIEFGLWNDRLLGSVEFFSRKAEDLLFRRAVAPSLGYANYPDNIGDMRNTGVEIDLTGNIIVNKDFRWSVNVNATHYKNKILSLPPENEKVGGLVSGYFKYTVGGSIYDYYLREWAGVDSGTGKGMWWKYNEDGSREKTDSYQDATQRLCGASALPKLYGGFGTSLTYKGIDLSINFAYSIGGKHYDMAYGLLMHAGTSYDHGYNWHNDILNAWTPENPNTDVPTLNYDDVYANSTSTRFLIDASYLSLQNITVGYTLPASVGKALGIGPVRIYAVADNVALISKRKGYDPRMYINGIGERDQVGGQNYAPIRTISGGISIKF